jgi:hypothetical protein
MPKKNANLSPALERAYIQVIHTSHTYVPEAVFNSMSLLLGVNLAPRGGDKGTKFTPSFPKGWVNTL